MNWAKCVFTLPAPHFQLVAFLAGIFSPSPHLLSRKDLKAVTLSMGLVGYLVLKFGCFRRRADPLFDQDKEMKFKLWKFRCRHNQWGETWGLRGRCRRAFEVPLNPLIKALVCSEARWLLPPR